MEKSKMLLIGFVFLFVVVILIFYNYRMVELELKYVGEITLPDSIISDEKFEFNPFNNNSPGEIGYISSQEEKSQFEELYKQELPAVDFSKNYLYVPHYKKIISARYAPKRNMEKYEFREYYVGEIQFDSTFYKNSVFIYRTDKIKIMP